jgi:hypothetical protein
VEIPEVRSPLGRSRCRLEDNIKMDHREVEWGHGLNLFGSGQGQVAGCCKCAIYVSVFQRFTSYQFSIAIRHICRFIPSLDVKFFLFITLSNSFFTSFPIVFVVFFFVSMSLFSQAACYLPCVLHVHNISTYFPFASKLSVPLPFFFSDFFTSCF